MPVCCIAIRDNAGCEATASLVGYMHALMVRFCLFTAGAVMPVGFCHSGLSLSLSP